MHVRHQNRAAIAVGICVTDPLPLAHLPTEAALAPLASGRRARMGAGGDAGCSAQHRRASGGASESL